MKEQIKQEKIAILTKRLKDTRLLIKVKEYGKGMTDYLEIIEFNVAIDEFVTSLSIGKLVGGTILYLESKQSGDSN